MAKKLFILTGVLTSFFLIQFFLSPNWSKHYRPFEPVVWKNWKESENDLRLRWEMIGDLNPEKTLIGKSKAEIIEILGQPDNQSLQSFGYHLGMVGSGVSAGSLAVYFDKKGTCLGVRVSIH